MASERPYGDNIEGIPLPGTGDMPQVKGSAAPNRPEPETAFNPEGEDIEYPVDYFDAEQRELGGAEAPFVANKDDQDWSAGLEDEENDYGEVSFAEQDANVWQEGAFPETQPLYPEGTAATQSQEEFSDIVLEPDNIQYGPD